MAIIDDTLITKISYDVDLWKETTLNGLKLWIHIQRIPHEYQVIYRVSLMNEEQETVYYKDFNFVDINMDSDYFIKITKQTMLEYDTVRKENFSVNIAANNFDYYESNWFKDV